MSSLGDLISDAIKKRRKDMQDGNSNAEAMLPEDQAVAEEEKKSKRFAKIKQMLGY